MNMKTMMQKSALRTERTWFRSGLLLRAAAMGVCMMAGLPVQAASNVGTGGTVTYTDASGLNPAATGGNLGGVGGVGLQNSLSGTTNWYAAGGSGVFTNFSANGIGGICQSALTWPFGAIRKVSGTACCKISTVPFPLNC